MLAPDDESSEVILGPSRHLPWPLDVAARRGWDEAAIWYRMQRHGLPVGVAQAVAASVDLVQRPRLGVWHATSDDRTGILVLANDPLIRHSLLTALGARGAERRGSVARTSVRPEARFDADVTAVEIPSFASRSFARAGWLLLPRWVSMEVDLGQPESEMWDARKRETVRRIERSGLDLEVARGGAAAREFYSRMYAPTAQARHAGRAIVLRPGQVEAAVRRGWILFVRSGAERVAGLLLVPRPRPAGVLDALLFGVATGEYAGTSLAREAAYLFSLRWARDVNGASRLGLTAAAPLVHDGILRFKKRWGAAAVADLRQASCIAVRITRGSPGLVRALTQQPFVTLRWNSTQPSLCALALRESGKRALVPATPGVDVEELELRSHADLPRVFETWARSAS